jgi:plastocyanin
MFSDGAIHAKSQEEVQSERNDMTASKMLWKVAVPGLFALVVVLTSSANEIKGKVSVQGLKSAENIAVYVDVIPDKKFDAPKEHVVIDQRKMAFIPHVVAVQQGTTVDFLNSDPVGHNVYWPSISGNKKLSHNLGTWPKGDKKPFQFNDLGVASLLCNVHPEMSGYAVVVPTPYYAVTDKDGNFEIKNIPAGKYTLKTWSEDGKPTTQAVDVSAATTTVELTVKK